MRAELITNIIAAHCSGDENILMAETLLYHGAETPIKETTKEKITRDENEYYGNICGTGALPPAPAPLGRGSRPAKSVERN